MVDGLANVKDGVEAEDDCEQVGCTEIGAEGPIGVRGLNCSTFAHDGVDLAAEEQARLMKRL